MPAGVGEPLRLNQPEAFPPSRRPTNQTRRLHDLQVFRDRLSGHVEALGEPGNRRRSRITQPRDESESSLVTKGKKHRRRIGNLRLRPEVTLSAQGASRWASSPLPTTPVRKR